MNVEFCLPPLPTYLPVTSHGSQLSKLSLHQFPVSVLNHPSVIWHWQPGPSLSLVLLEDNLWNTSRCSFTCFFFALARSIYPDLSQPNQCPLPTCFRGSSSSRSRSSSTVTASSPVFGWCACTHACRSLGRMLKNCSSTSRSKICSLVWHSGLSHWRQSSQSWERASRGPGASW